MMSFYYALNGKKFFQLVSRSKGATKIRSSAWLEHYTDNVGVTSSNLVGSTAAAEAFGAGGQEER